MNCIQDELDRIEREDRAEKRQANEDRFRQSNPGFFEFSDPEAKIRGEQMAREYHLKLHEWYPTLYQFCTCKETP